MTALRGSITATSAQRRTWQRCQSQELMGFISYLSAPLPLSLLPVGLSFTKQRDMCQDDVTVAVQTAV